ncbi:MAG TPA: hypothetical protein VMZ52_11995 [Bryobacteraceae bacterium]|nr:hypothetical protein [Bryobacteraceae bacterium]
MLLSKALQVHYSEIEAAERLGVSIEELRSLVRNHIVQSDDELPNLESASFKQSDLVVLKIFASQIPSVSRAPEVAEFNRGV